VTVVAGATGALVAAGRALVLVPVDGLINALVDDGCWSIRHPSFDARGASLSAHVDVVSNAAFDENSYGVNGVDGVNGVNWIDWVDGSVLVRVVAGDSEVADDSAGAVTVGSSGAGSLEVGGAGAVVPAGEDETHFTFDGVGERVQVVVTAVSLHHDLVTALGQGSAKSPEGDVGCVRDELGLDHETIVGVDEGATGTVGASAILGNTIGLHVHVTLGCGVARSVSTGMGGNIEAVPVGLHDIDACAAGVRSHGSLATGGAGLNHIDASNTAAVDGAEVDVIHDAATSDTGLVNGINGIVHGVLHEHGRVVVDGQSGSRDRALRGGVGHEVLG